MTGEETIAAVRAETDTVLLAFSCGKDSLAAWLAMRPHFKRIIPVYQYLIPGLGFVEKSIKYYEDFFQTRIYQYPHPGLYRMLRNYMFQPPENTAVITMAALPIFDFDYLRDVVCDDVGVPRQTWIAVGTRSCDSQARRVTFMKYGSMRKSHHFFPVWDWNKKKLVEKLHEAKVKLPAEYRFWGRSFDGLDFRFLWAIKENWPADYRKILDLFPLAELEIKRYEFAERRKACQSQVGG